MKAIDITLKLNIEIEIIRKLIMFVFFNYSRYTELSVTMIIIMPDC